MDPNLARLRYALAHVRLFAKGDPSQWRTEEILDCFFLLPPPMVSFEEWMSRHGNPPAITETPIPKTMEEAAEANEDAIKSLAGIPGVEIKVAKSDG